jgi:DNA-binding transcriptional LysR family regulator
MDWTQIPYFLEIARSGSLRAATEKLGVTHATVNRNLQALEDSYGVRLFDRSRSGLTLTSAGETLFPIAEEAERSIISGRRKLQGLDREATGLVRLSIPTVFASMVMPEILVGFSDAYPEIELEVSVTNRFENLNRAEADVSVRVAHNVDDDVVGRKVLQYSQGIFASKPYLAQHFEKAGKLGEGLCWLGWGDRRVSMNWVKNSPFPKAEIKNCIRSPTLMSHMICNGAGMSYLPCFVAQLYPQLVQVPGTDFTPDRSIWILLHSDLQRTTRVRLLVDFLVKKLREQRSIFVATETL